MDVSTPPSLDLACPQAKAKLKNNDHIIWEREVSIKIEYGHESIMKIIIAASFQSYNLPWTSNNLFTTEEI